MIMSLTQNEKKFLAAVINYLDLPSQQSDNYSNAGVSEAAVIMGGQNQGKGLVGSLVAKGIGYMDDDGYDLFWIFEEKLPEVYKEIGLVN